MINSPIEIYDAGHQAFRRRPAEAYRLAKVDLRALLALPNARKAIQAVPTQLVYFDLKERGLQDSLEVLNLLSNEQFARLCDYDVWHEDVLIPRKLFQWLALYHEIDPKQMFGRFRALDEEYQIASLAPFIRVYTEEEYERMTDEEQDRLYRFPNDALYYAVKTDDEEIHQGIEKLMSTGMGEDMAYTLSLIMHAAYVLPSEQEALVGQFRRARLEEDGFVSFEESLGCFIPLTIGAVAAPAPSGEGNAALATKPVGSFLERVLRRAGDEDLQRGFLHLANALCSATKIEPDDFAGLRRVLEHTAGLCSLSLEYLSGGDVERAVSILRQEYPKRLFRMALSLIDRLRQNTLLQLEKAGLPGVDVLRQALQAQKYGLLLDTLDKKFLDPLGFEATEILKALFNRLPLVPVEKDGLHFMFAPIQTLADLQVLGQRMDEIVRNLPCRPLS